jgi:hypothetical protein
MSATNSSNFQQSTARLHSGCETPIKKQHVELHDASTGLVEDLASYSRIKWHKNKLKVYSFSILFISVPERFKHTFSCSSTCKLKVIKKQSRNWKSALKQDSATNGAQAASIQIILHFYWVDEGVPSQSTVVSWNL